MAEAAIGSEGGLDWVLAGGLGALMSAGDDALVVTLQAFAISLGLSEPDAFMAAKEWLPLYRGHLKSRGVANA